MESFNNFSKKDIPDFIKIGNDLIDRYNKLKEEDILIMFQEYSRYYMNFIMNHTNFIHILYIYKLLLLKINKNVRYITYIIPINNYVLSILNKTNFKQKIIISTKFIEYNNYFVAVKNLTTTDYIPIQLEQRMNPKDIVINLNILENKQQIIKDYTVIELNDYIRFFHFIGYEIYLSTNFNIISELLDELKKDELTHDYIDRLLYIIRSFYNILLMKFSKELTEFKSVINPLTKRYDSNNCKINEYMYFIIPQTQTPIFNKSIVMGITTIIGFLFIDSKYNLL